MSTTIYELFANSPFSPLQQHMSKVQECADTLLPFMQAAHTGDWEQAQSLQQVIIQYEEEADAIKRELRLHLPKGLFLPVPRGDLLMVLRLQDQIANKAKDIAGLVLGRKMAFPASVFDSYITFLEQSVQTSQQAHSAIHQLEELLEIGFKGHEVAHVESMVRNLDALEHGTDQTQIAVRQQLFAEEQKLPPIHAMFLYQVIDWTAALSDTAQSVGGHLLLLLAR